MAAYPKTIVELSRKPIPELMKEIKILANGLERIFLDEGLSPEAEEILWGRIEQLSERIVEVYGRKLSQRINYWDSLKAKLKMALKTENFDAAHKIKNNMGYFKHFLKDDLPASYF